MRGLEAAALLCVVASICGPAAAVPPPPFATDAAPRAFGHFIGDRLTRHVEMVVPPAYRLTLSALPRPGRANTWLELTRLGTARTEAPAGASYHIDLEYQIVGSAAQPLLTVLPGIELHFSDGTRALERRIDEWPVAIAPLTPAAGGVGRGVRVGLEEIRPARPPTLIDGRPVARRLVLSGAATAALLVGFAMCVLGWPRRRPSRAPFAAAVRTLRALPAPPAAAADVAALRAVHRAFDDTFGRRMFAEHLDELLERHPHFADKLPEAQRFFAVSRATFFGHGPPGGSAPRSWLLALCREFAVRERRSAARRPA